MTRGAGEGGPGGGGGAGWTPLRPARDLGLKPGERLRSLGREPGLVGLATQAAWRGLVRAWLRAAHGFEVSGREHLPAEPPYVLVANHASHLDALALGAALRGAAARRSAALAAGETFFGTGAGAAFAAYALGALPVWRGKTRGGDVAMLRARLAEDGLVYILFPEGTRSRTGEMASFKPGLGTLVAGTGVPVVPCWLDGAHAAWPPHRRAPRPGARVRLSIGPPLRFEGEPNTSRGWVQVAREAEAAVRVLAPGGSLGAGV